MRRDKASTSMFTNGIPNKVFLIPPLLSFSLPLPSNIGVRRSLLNPRFSFKGIRIQDHRERIRRKDERGLGMGMGGEKREQGIVIENDCFWS